MFLYLIQYNFIFVFCLHFFYHYLHPRVAVTFCLKFKIDYNEIGSKICFEHGMTNIYRFAKVNADMYSSDELVGLRV